MLPIRLGTLNARGDQDLFVYALTREGQVETTNYRTQKIPSGQELPVYIKDEFPDFPLPSATAGMASLWNMPGIWVGVTLAPLTR